MKKKIIIDLFAGAGGESCGIHKAFEERDESIQLFAVNHWERACETHAANFPADECICQDIQTVIPTSLVHPGEQVELMWASPECIHFSTARGGKPMDDQSRCTPFDIIRWVTMLNVKRLVIENVPEFQSWGPLNEQNRPIEERGFCTGCHRHKEMDRTNCGALMLVDRLAALRGPTRELPEAGDTGRDMGAARKNRLGDGQ